YIAAYPAGIRENGGQYTHGVLWTAWALLLLGRGEQAHELLSDLNPIAHSADAAQMAKYQVEPYVLAADVYSQPPHVGRGGWTWYTGSAAWMYRLGVEWLLGIRRRGAELELEPCVPPSWTHFEVKYQASGAGTLSLIFENPERISRGIAELVLDGQRLEGPRVPLPSAGEHRQLRVRLGSCSAVAPSVPARPRVPASRRR
ncbi:MAG TPA: hypothetical protein VLC09_17405, partial [Polyangiaceae bacterium]|nr:hypothetical protein [Polyangiaceae bacterium]